MKGVVAFLLVMLAISGNLTAQQTVNDFQLRNVDGKVVSLSNYPDAKGFIVVFTCNHCPFAKLYPQRLNLLNEKYLPQHVPVIAVSSTDTILYQEDDFRSMVKTSKAKHFSFPYLFDGTQQVAKDFKAERTPHAFIIWKENGKWVVKYNGAIDDNGAEPSKVTEPFVANAVDALLAGKPVAQAATGSVGCAIHFRK